MKKSKITLIVVIAVVAVIIIFGWSTYNNLIKLTTTIDTQWAQVETQYQRRYDLIPNLVESAKGLMTQEKEVFIAIADARKNYAGAITIDDKVKATTQVESALGRLLAIIENYPQLRTAEAIQTLMVQLEGTENRVSVERQRFNDDVRLLNIAVKTFPSNLVASIFGFGERTYFEAAKGAENAPAVKF